MSKNVLSPNQHRIYEFCKGLYGNEKFFEKQVKNHEYQGYLIEKKMIDEIKTKISYDKLKYLVENEQNQETYDIIKKNIKEINIGEIIPTKYNSSKELMKDLNNKKSFYFIKQDYINRISDTNKAKGKEIKLKLENNILKLIFGEKDELDIPNNNNGIIQENSLLTINEPNNSPKKTETTKENSKSEQNENIKFKDDMEILVRLFYYNKYLKRKDISSFKTLKKEEDMKKVYLIHNSWMEEFKSYFDYQFIENYLKNKKEYSNTFVKNNYYLSIETINIIIRSLPVDYIIY
jgi:hypothetical protein